MWDIEGQKLTYSESGCYFQDENMLLTCGGTRRGLKVKLQLKNNTVDVIISIMQLSYRPERC